MKSANDPFDELLSSIERLKKFIRKGISKQVKNVDEKQSAKSVATYWFRTAKPALLELGVTEDWNAIDDPMTKLLEYSDRAVSRSKYLESIGQSKKGVLALRTRTLIAEPAMLDEKGEVPSFIPLVSNEEMQEVLRRRWKETQACMNADAHLAATVMMGALLEALILARANRLTDLSPLFRLSTCPKDKKSGKALPLQKWTLNDYINVAHEMSWIGNTAKDVSNVMRDYRNFIHPAKEISEGLVLGKNDTLMLWAVFVQLVNEIIDSV